MATETPGMVCGPTTGCGQATPMVPTLVHTTGGVENGWQVPAACMHCGKPFSGSARIDNPPPIAALAPWFVFGASRSSGEPSAIPEEPAVHNHGSEGGPGLACPERRCACGSLRGRCLDDEARDDLKLVTDAAGWFAEYECSDHEQAVALKAACARLLSGGIPRSLSEEPEQHTRSAPVPAERDEAIGRAERRIEQWQT